MAIEWKEFVPQEVLTAGDLQQYAVNNGAVRVSQAEELSGVDASVGVAYCAQDADGASIAFRQSNVGWVRHIVGKRNPIYVSAPPIAGCTYYSQDEEKHYIYDGDTWQEQATQAALDAGLAGKANTSHGNHVPNNNNVTFGEWYLSPGAANETAWCQGKSYFVAHSNNYVKASLGAQGYGGTAFSYANSATPWANPYLLSVMTAIQQFAPASSADVKDNIELLTTPDSDTRAADADTYVTDAFANINPIHFTYKDDERIHETNRGRARFGFLAEEVHAAGVPTDEWVFDLDTGETDDDGLPVMEKAEPIRLLKEIDLVAILWAKVQELEQRLEELEGNK